MKTAPAAGVPSSVHSLVGSIEPTPPRCKGNQVTSTPFFVRAKDKNGHRVMMIGPDSTTTITNASSKSSKGKTGDDKTRPAATIPAPANRLYAGRRAASANP